MFQRAKKKKSDKMVCKEGSGIDRKERNIIYCAVPDRDDDGACVCGNAGPIVEVGGILHISCLKHGPVVPYSMYSR